jgi:hypothetical protein
MKPLGRVVGAANGLSEEQLHALEVLKPRRPLQPAVSEESLSAKTMAIENLSAPN